MIEGIEAFKVIIDSITGARSLLRELSSSPDLGQNEIQEKLREMSSQLMNTQSEALNLQMQLAEILTRNRELGEEVERLKRWSVQAENYVLKNIDNTAFVYALKEGVESPEPPHWLCQLCFEDARRSILQSEMSADFYTGAWKCSFCDSRIMVNQTTNPSSV